MSLAEIDALFEEVASKAPAPVKKKARLKRAKAKAARPEDESRKRKRKREHAADADADADEEDAAPVKERAQSKRAPKKAARLEDESRKRTREHAATADADADVDADADEADAASEVVVEGTVLPVDVDMVAKFAVEPGLRKSKVRQQLDLERTAGEYTAPPEKRQWLSEFADMPDLDSPFALDDWTQRYRSSISQTAPVAERRKSIATSIRESLAEKEAAADRESESSDTDDDAKAADAPPPPREITIEDFFSGDADPPLTGSAATMHDMLVQMRADIERREALTRDMEVIPRQPAPQPAREPKNKRRRKDGKKDKKKNKDKEAAAAAAAAAAPPNQDDVLAEVVHGKLMLSHLEACSRAYCADFFRQPRGEEFGERACHRGKSCVFVLLASRYPDTAAETVNEDSFVCREFLRPSELDVWVSKGRLPAQRRLCLGCERMVTTFYYYLHLSRGEAPAELIQTHCNIIDEPGEYDAARCLYPNPDVGGWTGIARPFVEFAPNTFVPVRFEVTAATTGRQWLLCGVREEMTDFRLSPSRYDMAAAEEAAEVELRRVVALDGTVEAAVRGGLPQDPRGSWVAGVPGAMACGVPPCRPLRPLDRIEAERLADPPLPSQKRPDVFVPRTLLGQAFPEMAASVFCPFGETLAMTRAHPASAAAALAVRLETEVEMHSFSADLLRAAARFGMTHAGRGPDDVDVVVDGEQQQQQQQHGARYATLLTVLYRVEFATRCMGRSRGGGDDDDARRYDYWLQLFIDTHIDLCIAMHETGLFDDATLEDVHANPHSLAESLLVQHWPHDTRCAHAGGLPDLSACIQFASVWFQVRNKSRADNVAEALIHLIACKTQTHKCQVRNFAHVAFAYAQQFPQIMTLFRALIEVSLLGNYPHARRRPGFAARLHIVFSARRETASDRELFLWIEDNEQLMYAIVKEYYRYLVSHRPAFEAVLEATTHWAVVRGYIRDAMDRARTVVEIACARTTLSGLPDQPQRPGFAGHGPMTEAGGGSPFLPTAAAAARSAEAMLAISEDMLRLHEQAELPLITKLRKGTFAAMILPEMTRFFARAVRDDHCARPQTSLACLATEIGADAAGAVVRAMRYAVERRVPQREGREPLELGWLGYLGVSREGLARLRALCYDYEVKDIADNSIAQRIRAVFDARPRDFFLMHTFFKIVSDWRATASFELPLCYARTQSAALRAKTFTPPWAALRADADVFYWCPACRRWLSDVVETDDPATREFMHSNNFRHALFSHDTQRIYCDRQRVPVNTRKQVESGRYADLDAHIDDVREALRVRHYLSTPLCCSVPAVPVHMVGRCQRLGGKLWALCECCGTLTQWDGSKFGPAGFTCGFHSADAPRTMTAHQAEAVRLRELRSQLPPAEKCSFCHNVLKPGEDYAQTTVLDDCGEYLHDDDDGKPVRAAPTWRYIPFVLCHVDGGAVSTWHDPVVRRSVLEKGILRVRHWRIVSWRRFGRTAM